VQERRVYLNLRPRSSLIGRHRGILSDCCMWTGFAGLPTMFDFFVVDMGNTPAMSRQRIRDRAAVTREDQES